MTNHRSRLHFRSQPRRVPADDGPSLGDHKIGLDTKIPLASQVGGHPGLSTSEDGSLLIKPTLAQEVSFYEHLASDPVFAPLRPHIPKFYGALKFEEEVEGGNPETLHAAPKGGKDKCLHLESRREPFARVFITTAHSIVLENLSSSFSKPNILDIKLGTKYHDDKASEEKKARMIQAAKTSTSAETGIRLTGFQVYDTSTGQAVNTPRTYGKSIKASDLPDGVAKFFPIHSEQSTQGLPKEQLLPVVDAVRKRVAVIRDAFARLEIRMVGGSFLIIYEGDLERVKRGIDLLEEGAEEDEDVEDVDAGMGEEEEGEESDGPGPPYLVKLIDFAHTEAAAGEGPDEGVLLGMDTTLKLLDGRISQIRGS